MKLRTIPFGYQMINGEIVPHLREANAVRRIFELYIGGLSYKLITKELCGGDILYRPGVTWNQHMVKRILENRRYIGENEYPALITAHDIEAVAARKENNPHCRQQRREKPVQTSEYVLLPYTPTPKVRRMTNEINRALEKSPDPEIVRGMIFACAAEKYNSIGVIVDG